MVKRRRKKRRFRQTEVHDRDDNVKDETVKPPVTGSTQSQENESSKAGNQVSERFAREVKESESNDSRCAADLEMNATPHFTAESSKAGNQVSERFAREVKESESNDSRCAADLEMNATPHFTAESSKAGNQVSERFAREVKESESNDSRCAADLEMNATPHFTAESSKADNQVSERFAREVKESESNDSRCAADVEMNATPHFTADSETVSQLSERICREVQETETNQSVCSADAEMNTTSHSIVESGGPGSQLSGNREVKETETIHSATPCGTDTETNLTSHSTAANGCSSKRPAFKIKPYRRMVRRLETALSHKEVIEMAQLTEQSPDFILRISELDAPLHLLMANLEKHGIVTEDSFEVLIDILDEIEATDALELVKTFTSTSSCKDEMPSNERGVLKRKEPENSLTAVACVEESFQQGARRRVDKRPSNASRGISKQGQSVSRGRAIACSWEDVSPLLDSFGIRVDSGQRLSVVDSIVLHRIHLHESVVTPKNVLVAFLSRLMSYDYRSMRLFKELDYNEFPEVGKSSTSRVKSNVRRAHQKLSCRDLIHAIIRNCDPFLQQEVLCKMSACQLAVPVLLPDASQGKVTMLLWGLQRISKAWQDSKTSQVVEEAVVNFPFPVVAALRFGNTGFSKSNILNKMLGSSQGNDDHPYFLSHEQDSKRSLLSKGSLEAVWYLPNEGKKGKQSLSEAICFLNLRGDATEFTKQQNFANSYSLITIVFIGKTEMNAKHDQMRELSKKSRLIVVMGSDDASRPLLEEEGDDAGAVIVRNNRMSIFDASQMNALDISEKLCVEVKSILERSRNISDDVRSLGDALSVCEEHRIDVDMHNEECMQAKKAAEGVLHSCREGPKAYKSHALPLQLNWQEWSRLDKDRSWKGAHGDVEKELAKLHKAKEYQRKKQREIGLSKEMQILFKELSNPSPTYRQFLLFWLQYSLNEISLASLRPLVNRLKAIRNEARETAAKITHLRRNTGDDDASVSASQRESVHRQVKELTAKETRLQKDLVEKTEQFDACSLGFEHFVREFGQIYECFHNNPGRNETTVNVPFNIKSLPQMAAEMLLSGQPLEIFDGDACHVPIKWVKGVLAGVRDLVGDASVYVISVIGIQSSGKSTLLNSMFGVRFAVSAGRCTRGVFLQLLPISDDLKGELGCDFIAVIDTEGLKAPEKAIANRKNEDNELATFALCLSDMTLINIGGQTVGEDLSNILQISAHAFIRMKEVHLRSSCYLIQQFVADITAQYRNQSSTQSILQKLDQAVVTAAIEERKHDQYRQFSDCFNIVNIDGKSKYVQYVPSLWRSSMSAPNHEYSETVLRLKSSLLEEAKGERRKQKISEFTNRIDNVWNAIKQEDFVFNFCNTNEISQYNNFTRFYKRQQLNLTQEMINWELEAKQKIKNTTADNVNSRRTILFQELDEKLGTMVDQIKTFLEEELKVKGYESVRQHSTFFYRDLELMQTQTRETVRSMLNLESSIILNAKTKEDQLLPKLIGELRRKVLTVAEAIKQELSEHNEEESNLAATQQAEEKVKAMFEEEWLKQMTLVELEYPTKSENDIKLDIEKDINMCIMESLQNTSLSKDMKELLNSHKLSALCQEPPVVNTTEDIARASRLIGRCSKEITRHVEKLQSTAQIACRDGKFKFSKDFVIALKGYFESILLQPCDGCKDKTALLLCLSCSVLQIAHSATKSNILDQIMRNKNLLNKLGKNHISSICKIKREVKEQLKEYNPDISNGILKKLSNFLGDFLSSAQGQSDENFHNQLRMKFHSDNAREGKDRWYSVESVKNFIATAQELVMTYRWLDERRRQQLLGDACSFFVQEAYQSEKKALAKELSWMVVQVTLKCEAIEIIDQINVFVEVLQDVLPDNVCNTLTSFSESMIDKLSRITLTNDRRHSIDEFFILHIPTLDKENYDTILSVIRDSRELFLGQIKSSGVYNTNLIRSLLTTMSDDLARYKDLGRVEQSLVIAHVCSWALPICIGIQLTFERQKSVSAQLEKEKKRLFLDFKSLCEGACQDKLAAKSFCAIIEESLKDSLKTRICSALFERLSKAGDEIFYSRSRFLQVVLESLCKEENFNNYTQFLRQHASFIQKWTLDFIASQCCDDIDTQISIKDMALYEIDQLIRSTEELLEANLRHVVESSEAETSSFEMWAGSFIERFESSLNSSLNEEKMSTLSLHFLLSDCELFTKECKLLIRSSTRDVLLDSLELPDTSSVPTIRQWFDACLPKKLHALLAESVRGCGSQCPFCKTFCDDTVKEHNVHMSNLHFPIGVGGWRGRLSRKLASNTCTANVASEGGYYKCHCDGHDCNHSSRPYKEYRQDYPDWDIKPISNYEATLYWKWVLIRFNEDFANYYNCKTADIPWGTVSKEEALRSIRNEDL